ncbi:hypothetical protein D3C71_1868430 [compost metagenome]
MKERMALIWFSCFCWASAIFRVMPRFCASLLATEVSAARQPDSEPIWEKPTVISAEYAEAERIRVLIMPASFTFLYM